MCNPNNHRPSGSTSLRSLFMQHVAQTSPAPMGLEVERAEGIYLYTADGRRYVDLVSGVSVSNVGHCHPKVVAAVQQQAAQYMHLMVYGEYIQTPQVMLAQKLCSLLPASLSNVYFVSSGSEAIEGALKLAKRYTQRSEIACFRNAYHGSTHGALSLVGSNDFKRTFLPLLPNVTMLDFNCDDAQLQRNITQHTACVVVEPIQGEAGIRVPRNNFLQSLREQCSRAGALLVFDEVQSGVGRTGAMFAFERYGAVPDVLVLGKAFGGGMPLGAFVASREVMSCLANPALGHITTFGGHPVSSAAGLAALQVLSDENLVSQVERKRQHFLQRLAPISAICEVRGEGLMLAVELGCEDALRRFYRRAFELGLVIDWFLFCPTAFRIAPPLTISSEEIDMVCDMIAEGLK